MTCIECGDEIEFRWVEEHNTELRRRRMCFIDAFWAEMVEKDAARDNAITTDKYWHFVVGDEEALPKRGPGRGFDGRRVRVHFRDGRQVESTNLWSQGEIPDHWRNRFAPNATLEWT